jgi:phosphoglycolate phosphatase-like HAD superfamily hydrolase
MKASASTSKKSLRPKGLAPATFAAKADPNHRLILFDIDGTLVLTGGAGGRAMSHAFEHLFSIADAFRGIPMAGRTDPAILSDALTAHGIAASDPRIASYRDCYFRMLRGEIQRRPPGARHGVMPGVRELLDALSGRDDVHLALLTGNYEVSARMKLEFFDLWRYFVCGAFGDEAADRNGLFAVAQQRLAAHGGPLVRAERAVVIGDTPHDVAVAIAAGARSIGVATGSHSVDALQAAGADCVFDDLSNTDAVLQALA